MPFLSFGEIDYKPLEDLSLKGRLTFFDSPQVDMSAVEFIWKDALIPYYWKVRGRGMKFYMISSYSFLENHKIWFKYENVNYSSFAQIEDEGGFTEEEKDIIHILRFQYDFKW